MTLELKYELGTQVWGINNNVPIELNVAGYRITASKSKPGYILEYYVHNLGDASTKRYLNETDVFPTKQTAKLKLKEIENLRHLEELNKIENA